MNKIILAFLLMFTGGQLAHADIVSNLVAYYMFNSTSGTTAIDSISANDGTLTNGPTWGPGKIGNSIIFATSDGYVSIPDATANNPGAFQDFTIAYWTLAPTTQVNTANNDNNIIEKWSTDLVGGYPYVSRIFNQNTSDNGKIKCARYDGSNNPNITSTTTINDGHWHHVAFTKVGGTLTLYVDAVSQGTTADTTTSITNSTPLFVGARGTAGSDNSSGYYTGNVDEFRIYNRGLSAGDVQELYDYGAASFRMNGGGSGTITVTGGGSGTLTIQ